MAILVSGSARYPMVVLGMSSFLDLCLATIGIVQTGKPGTLAALVISWCKAPRLTACAV